MATPQNPLDRFVTYTTHFELHAADSWTKLKDIPASGTDMATTERNGVETLLINTRKDAHQHIDNVRFRYLGPTVDPSATLMPIAEVTLDVIEPNGTFFIEKLQNQASKYNISSFSSGMIFGLKIIFVGRLENGAEATLPLDRIIALQCIGFNSSYSHKGGEHHLSFMLSGTALTASAGTLATQNGLTRAVAYTNKNVSFKAKTVQEAIPLLEQQLNKNYKDVYENELKNCAGAKPIRYRIELDPKIAGELTLVTKADTYRPDEKCHLTFTPNIDIGSMIRNILTSSKEVNEMIAASQEKINRGIEEGVKIPMLQGFYHLTDSELEIFYKISLYEGGGEVFEFNYYFSGPGKNVDVLEFETKFPTMFNWLSNTIAGTELNRNANSTIPKDHPDYYKNNVVHPDITRKELIIQPQDRKCIPVLSGDVAPLPGTNRSEGTGYAKHDANSVPAAKLAFQTIGQMVGARDPTVSFTIRGHKGLLDKIIVYPDGSEQGYGMTENLWTKVNIFNADGSPFFYTGKYKMMTIDNIFSGGKFTQILTVLMLTAEQQGIDRNEN